MAHNYDKIRLIGKGSFGQVFLAKKFNSTSTQRYVIKVSQTQTNYIDIYYYIRMHNLVYS